MVRGKAGIGLLALVAVMAVGGLLTAACTVPVISPTPAADTVQETGDQVNVARQAGLAETVKIEVMTFSDEGDPGYRDAGAITDEATIQEIVAVLDTDLALLPRVTCVDQYKLRFTLSDGVIHEFGYYCAAEGSFLHGGPPFLTGYDVQPPDRLRELIEEAISAD